ncbi:hypothetical protein RP300_01745 [Oligella urethralis]|uniref:Uncharacterized protein n=1 Tax=Oligella urethralis TaxID=90245 RepID=A0A2X1VFQ0_9BURK|nr:hypothetical protein RP300_01745 [Oligella urethralis]SPY07190.1 Uncharacterised protein [Oligella urethralis]SUA54526.1 Uncharacterised protein [Oligella urethralis]SUA65086.1 Uncharacterised protein [Oligella urethralis]SUA66651.1 Uncharacterised protein [Oligella urethralis]
MTSALRFQKWFSRLMLLFVIWNCFGLRIDTPLDGSQASVSLFIKEAPSLQLIYSN